MKMNQYETDHADIVRRLAPECTVLLKKDGMFPLSSAGKIALYGSGARRTIKGGTGSGEVNSRYFITVEKGLKKAGFEITTNPWLDTWDEIVLAARKSFVREIRSRAKKKHVPAPLEGMGAVMPEPEHDFIYDGVGDTAIYVLARLSGEGSDRNPVKGDILLTDSERRDILRLNERYERFMLVLNVGGPVDLGPVADVKNILLLSQLGAETGTVLADLLLGRSYPSGKLTTTWTAWEDYPRIGEFGEQDDTRYREGIYVGYRYFDSAGKKPLYSFGFGLGYTDFSTEIRSADEKSVTAAVKNTGHYPGRETVQLYISCPQGTLGQPPRKLAAFAKTKELAPGEEQTLTIPYDLRDVSSYDEKASAYVLESGDYTVLAGETPAVTLRLDETAVLKKVRRSLGTPDFKDWNPASPSSVSAAEKILSISAGSFETEYVDYDTKSDIDPITDKMTDEELAILNVGFFDPKGGMASMIGSAGTAVAGAAGETAHVRGIPLLIMADGPAGLRLSREYWEDEKGIHLIGSSMPETILELLSPIERRVMAMMTREKKPSGPIKEQYCTAIPIGTAIAQSWNISLAEQLGDLVGDEMERFGIHLWLAPALNIHRDIRCGRNFEYFSEDPFVSGKFAAAITRGVQSHPGCGTTIKHFAVNNQEYNRTGSSSQVSKRAMREIYLRGFEICVKESQPHALMTSYNLLNGTHTSERRDLIMDILRAEWGYQGIVMTDWVVAGMKQVQHPKYRNALSDRVAAAGGDLFMPGCKGDVKNIMKALKKGTLNRRQLKENSTRVYRMAKKLTEEKHG